MMSTFVGAGMSVSMPKGGVAQLQPQRRITQRTVKITGWWNFILVFYTWVGFSMLHVDALIDQFKPTISLSNSSLQVNI